MIPIQLNSDADYIDFLKKLKARAALHQPITASAVQTTLDTMITNIQSENRGADAEAWRELVKAARGGDVDARAKVARIRVTKTTNFLTALSNWLMFFNKVTLADDEAPYWQNDSSREVLVAYSGADGKPRRSQVQQDTQFTQIALFKIVSEVIEYQLVDPYKGRIADETKKLVDIGRDLAVKIDQKAKPFVTGAIGNFTVTGALAGRTYVPHSVIATGNLPTSNAEDLSDAPDSSTRFSKACMDFVAKYCAQLSAMYGRPVKPEAILLPALDSTGHLTDVTFTSQPNSVVEQILGGGVIINYGGHNWPIIPDITLAPADGYAYVKLGAIGEFYEKPSLAEARDVITPESEANNKGKMWQANWIGFVAPKPWNPFVLRIKYK